MSYAPFPPPPAPPPPPAEKRPRRFSRTQKAVMAGGLAVGLALGGAGISFAASSGSPSTTAPPKANTPSQPVRPGHGPRPFAGGRLGFPGLGLGQVLYGQVTVRMGNGYQTINYQVGTADNAGSSQGISVKSANGHHQAYTVNGSTMVNGQLNGINSVKQGDQVEVISNSSYLAIRIVDLTGLKSSWAGFGFGPAGSGSTPAGPAHTAEAGAFGSF